ncbi:hypothetical protein [Lachnobacterium bovis]|uniref:hypothetical protein n=1 Tax=Lachnobacterium bovis TaxID=140626 RepID=UPI00048D6711|nr:hypothetical protein [Lachnobacterium bovis]
MDKLDKHVIMDGEEKFNIYLLPFVKASQVKHFYPEAGIETYEDAVKTIIDNSEIDENEK